MNRCLLFLLYFFFYLGAVPSSWAQSPSDSSDTSYSPVAKDEDVINYKYHYDSILLLDASIPEDQKKDWYFTFRQEIRSCEKRFVYPEDFEASIPEARKKFRDSCYYQTIVLMNDFENNLYFNYRKPEYDVYKRNAPFAQILEDSLMCDDCSLYPNRNSPVEYVYSPVLDKKIRVLRMNHIQRVIFTNIFQLSKDKTRIVDTSKEILSRWADRINDAKNRTQLKLVLDDFVNHIRFSSIETKNELIELGRKIDLPQNAQEIVAKDSKKE